MAAREIRHLVMALGPTHSDKWDRWTASLVAEDIYHDENLLELTDQDFDGLSITAYLKHLLRKFRRGQCAIGENIAKDTPNDVPEAIVHSTTFVGAAASWKQRCGSSCGQASCSINNMPRLAFLCNAERYVDTWLPFEHSEKFKRGIMNAKTGGELKEYILNVCNMWTLVMALDLGVVCACWELFPFDEVDPIFAAFFNGTLYVTFLCTLCCMLWFGIVVIVSSAVSPNNFKSFVITTLPQQQYGEEIFVVCIHLIILVISMLFIGKNMALSINDVIPTVCLVCVATFFVLPRFLFHVNWMSRCVFHCGLMGDIPVIHSVPSNMGTRETEKYIEAAVIAGAVFDEEQVCTDYRELARGRIPIWPGQKKLRLTKPHHQRSKPSWYNVGAWGKRAPAADSAAFQEGEMV
jgi:hypothetical protein